MASATLPTTTSTETTTTPSSGVIATQTVVRSPWAFGGPFSHEGPVPAVTESATLGDLDTLGRL